jgi:hypothetical protein
MSLRDLDLLKPLWHSHSAIMMFAVKAGTQLMLPWIWLLQKLTAGLPLPLFQPAYTIDAETKILGPLVKVLAALLDTQPELLLKDRCAAANQMMRLYTNSHGLQHASWPS